MSATQPSNTPSDADAPTKLEAFSSMARSFARQNALALSIGAGVALAAGSWMGNELINAQVLKKQATAMAQAVAPKAAAVDSFLFAADQQVSTQSAHAQKIIAQLKTHKDALSVTDGAPDLADIERDLNEAKQIATKRLAQDKAQAAIVRAGTASGASVDAMRKALDPEVQSHYKTLTDAALDGVSIKTRYSTELASVGSRAEQALDDAIETEAQVEKSAREALGKGWNGWDDAQKSIATTATSSLEASRTKIKSEFDKGGDASDWERYNQGYNAGIASANTQIQQDRSRLQERSHSGGMTFMDWYLLNHWINSANTRTVYVQTPPTTYYQQHPYVEPARPAKQFQPQVAHAPSQPLPTAIATGAPKIESKIEPKALASKTSPAPAPTVAAPSAAIPSIPTIAPAAALAAKAAAPKSAFALRNPYAANDPSSHLGNAATTGIATKVPEIKSFQTPVKAPVAAATAGTKATPAFGSGAPKTAGPSLTERIAAMRTAQVQEKAAEAARASKAAEAAKAAKASKAADSSRFSQAAQNAKSKLAATPTPSPVPAPSSWGSKASPSPSSFKAPSPPPSSYKSPSPPPASARPSPSPSPRPSPSPSPRPSPSPSKRR